MIMIIDNYISGKLSKFSKGSKFAFSSL